jgi:glucuronate isomerase
MKEFLSEDFMLESETARKLYFDYARDMPIYDYHCHLPPAQIALDHQFANMQEAWLAGDHYKWRAMRTNGVDERLITGNGNDREKFQAWAETVPHTIGNPLYHWTHMELKSPFGISGLLLNGDTAEQVWNRTGELLATDGFTARGIIKQMNVRLICTTDDPIDDLEYHKRMASDEAMPAKVLPAFRPDKAYGADDPGAYNAYLDKLAACAGVEISKYSELLEALEKRFFYFHDLGARLSDHALTYPVASFVKESEIKKAFRKVRAGERIPQEDVDALKTHILLFLGRLYARHGWVMQLHIGALRNNSSRMFEKLGPDTGFDSIADHNVAAPLSRFFDELDKSGELAKTIVYDLDGTKNDVITTMMGNFQDGSTPGKMQIGSGWWFNDQKYGMLDQMISLATKGLLSRFVGMLTDSRSFLSYPRHDYFRRILCSLIGGWVEDGEAPSDMSILGPMVQDISYNNALKYFEIPVT